jgi:hypothetical protein
MLSCYLLKVVINDYFQDIVRARFYNEFGREEIVDLNSSGKLASQIFIDRYLSLANDPQVPIDQLWDTTLQVLHI